MSDAVTSDERDRDWLSRHQGIGWSYLDDDQIEFLLNLFDLGVPWWVARQAPGEDQEFWYVRGWPKIDTFLQLSRIGPFEVGDAIKANPGAAVSVVDADVRNGADIDAVRAWLRDLGVTVWAEVRTAHDGLHAYISCYGKLFAALPTVKPHLPGMPGVELLSKGTTVSTPGTIRWAVGGRGYEIVFNNLGELYRLRQSTPDWHLHDLGNVAPLADWLASRGITRDTRVRTPGRRVIPEGAWPRLAESLHRSAMRPLIRFVGESVEGERNDRLLWAGCRAAEDGLLAEEGDRAWEELSEAASGAGLPDDEINNTLRSALKRAGIEDS